jgi:alpha-L-fucosidase 2
MRIRWAIILGLSIGAGGWVVSTGALGESPVAGGAAVVSLRGPTPGTPSQGTDDEWSDMKLWYRQPAAEWNEALPVGNGRLGAMVFGGTSQERIQLNEDTLWTGGPYDPSREGGAAALPQIQHLIFAGEYAKAHDLFGRTMMGIPYEQMKYQPLGDLLLHFPGHDSVTGYRLELDLDTAVATVTYRVGEVTYRREVFASPVDQVIVVRLTADRPRQISFSANLHGARNQAHSNYGTDYFWMDGLPPDGLQLTGKNSDFLGIEGRLRYEARVRARAEGGITEVDYRTLRVDRADAVTLFIAAATSFNSYKDVSGDPAARVEGALEAALDKPYQQMREEHIVEHRRLFRRVAIDLGTSAAASLPTDERVRRFRRDGEAGGIDAEALRQDADPQLAALYYQFGRYLLISSSRPGTEAANLQGIWNQDSNPWWDSKYTVNINLPMNYWPAEVGNLPELTEPLFDLVEEASEAGRSVAERHWGARGWVLHQNTDLWRATAPMDGPSWGAWPVGGAWLLYNLWEHYVFEPDEDYLESLYPMMRGSVQFFLDILVEHPRYGWLVTVPSNSPENFPLRPGNGRFFDEVTGAYLKARTIAAGPTMDMQILRALFDAFAEASATLGVDDELRELVLDARARLAPPQIGRHGQLQEWLEDWDDLEPEHRHLSHLWGVYPGDEISPETTPELAVAAARALDLRALGGCGWSSSHKMTVWARLLEGDRALENFNYLIAEDTLPNLFSLCGRALQVDGNFGTTAGIVELLLQSQGEMIRFLPSLPEAWATGSVRRLRARGGFEVGFDWRDGRLLTATIRSTRGRPCRIRSDEPLRVTSDGNEVILDAAEDGVFEFATVAGATYQVQQGSHPATAQPPESR